MPIPLETERLILRNWQPEANGEVGLFVREA